MGRHLPETKKRLQAEYRARHRDRLNEQSRLRAVGVKLRVLKHYGGKCVECGIDDYRALQLDHVDDNGAEHRKSIGVQAGYKFYQWVENNGHPEFLQILCANHNVIKQWDRTHPETLTKGE